MVVIDLQPLAWLRLLPADGAAAFLPGEERVVVGELDAVVAHEVALAPIAAAIGRQLPLAIVGIGGPAQAPFGVDLRLVGLAPGVDRRQPALAIFRILGVALAGAVGLVGHWCKASMLLKKQRRGVRRRAPMGTRGCVCRLPGDGRAGSMQQRRCVERRATDDLSPVGLIA